MTPTFKGRVQTRLLLLSTVGAAWTLLLALSFPPGEGVTRLGEVVEKFGVLFAVFFVGLGWETFYHLCQQLRWEKDWPTLLGLVTGVNEGITIWLLLRWSAIPWVPDELRPSLVAYVAHFPTTWLLVWLAANGPIRAALPRWRFRGGEVIA